MKNKEINKKIEENKLRKNGDIEKIIEENRMLKSDNILLKLKLKEKCNLIKRLTLRIKDLQSGYSNCYEDSETIISELFKK